MWGQETWHTVQVGEFVEKKKQIITVFTTLSQYRWVLESGKFRVKSWFLHFQLCDFERAV